MYYIKRSQAKEYSGDGYSGVDYPSNDKEINFAVIKIEKRSPKNGYQVNLECKELLYITKGSGTLYMQEDNSITEFSHGDVLVIDKGEYYAFDGNFEAAVPCTPSWTSEQHKYTEETK